MTMFKRSLIQPLVCSLILALGSLAASAQTVKLAGVDLKKLFDDYWKTQQSNNKLQAQREEMLKERNALTDKLKKTDEEYKKLLESASDPAISASEREKRKKQAEEKLIEFRQIEAAAEQFVRNASTTLQETEARMRNNIVKELKEAVAAKAKAAGYTMVIDTSADTPVGTPIFLYSTLEDITEALTAELNAKAPPGALDQPAPATPSGSPK